MSKKKKKPKTYTISGISEHQAHVLIEALELYSRIGMGQFHQIWHVFDFPSGADTDRLFDELRYEGGLKHGQYYGIRNSKIRDSFRISWDIYQVIRHRLAWDYEPKGGIGVQFDKPFKQGKEDLITFIENKEKSS